MSTRPRPSSSRWLGLLALGLVLAAGCTDPAAPPGAVIVRFEGAQESAVQPDVLVVWARYDKGGVRTVLEEPATVPIAGKDLFQDGVSIAFEPGPGVDAIDLWAVAVRAESGQGRWALGEPLLSGFGVIEGRPEMARVLMHPFEQTCDVDGDYFQSRCEVEGCCVDFVDDARFVDCVDDATTGAASRQANPFRASERESDGESCGNDVDDDCAGDGDVPCDAMRQDLDGDGDTADTDCDDDDPLRNSKRDEICGNGVDDDCDGLDELCDRDGDHYPEGEDCNDANPNINPGAIEANCDRRDEDCDGQVDEGLSCDDIDSDGVANDLDCPNGQAGPNGLPGEYDSGRSTARTEVCGNGVDDDCNPATQDACAANDADGDGFVASSVGGPDCRDNDPFSYPGAPEKCNDAIDQDCVGGPATCLNDADGDGFDAPADCNDHDATVHPPDRLENGQVVPMEICDGVDNDCDGTIDEGNPLIFKGDCLPGDPASECNFDGTGLHRRTPRCGSSVGQCSEGWWVCIVPVGGGTPYFCAGDTGPVTERCDPGQTDQNCNGRTDVQDGVTNDCEGCGTLDHRPQTVCGYCGRSRYLCTDPNSTACENPDAGRNACGGCTQLNNTPGNSCGEGGCGTFRCSGEDGVVCDNPGTNACGGCQSLNREPGTSCGECGTRVCSGMNAVRCDDPGRNACGGCSPLAHAPGESCGQCGSYVCDGNNAVRCDDHARNACNGCGTLTSQPGASCGTCDDGTVQCDGMNAVRCTGASARNACGGCQTLPNAPGATCGPCMDGAFACSGQEAVVCQGARATNACGGCGTLTNAPGGTCGCGGQYTCSGMNATACTGEDPRNACGGCATLPHAVGANCNCGGAYECNGMNDVMCVGGNVNACGGCNTLAHTPGTACGLCGAGQWECDGNSDVLCNGGNTTDAVGDVCAGTCGLWACNGNTPTCRDTNSRCASNETCNSGACECAAALCNGVCCDTGSCCRDNACTTTCN